MPRKPYTMTGNAAKAPSLKKRRKRSFSPSEPKIRKPQNGESHGEGVILNAKGQPSGSPHATLRLRQQHAQAKTFVNEMLAKTKAEEEAIRNKGGRPSKYSEALADEICLRLTDGQSLIAICRLEHMPERTTVVNWLMECDADPEVENARCGFSARYAQARKSQADLMDDMILDCARGVTPDMANADRVRILAYQWRAARLKPSWYGDRVVQEHTGADGGPLKLAVVVGEPVSSQEWAARHGGAAAAPAIEHAPASATEALPDEGEDAARKRHL